jgi:pilus assembly protein CpaB
MSIRTVFVVLLALVFGGSAAVLAVRLIQRPQPAPVTVETVPVVIAATEIGRGNTLTANMLKTHDFPKTLLPPDAVTRMEDAVGHVCLHTILKDETIMSAKLAPKGSGRGMAAMIPKGMRIVSIQTPSVASAGAGFIVPGNHVDVLLYMTAQSGGGTRLLMQDVEIWAVGPRIEAPAENKVDTKELREVTLLVRPEGAIKLVQAQNLGTLHLTLRNPEDKSPATMADLPKPAVRSGRGLGEQLSAALSALVRVKQSRPQTTRIRTFKGTQEGEVEVIAQEPGSR